LTTVLVIDDEPGIRSLVKMILETAGHRVYEAGTGEVGLSRINETDPDMVLLDIRLPDIDGWEVLRRLRGARMLTSLKVVMMSAHSSGHTMQRAIQEGCKGYVVKPFSHDQLLAQVEEGDPEVPPDREV
jgi:DNA-binding response OmpR family regulator